VGRLGVNDSEARAESIVLVGADANERAVIAWTSSAGFVATRWNAFDDVSMPKLQVLRLRRRWTREDWQR
jgi:predicted anti-sigma-YlaC factor YlaD